MKVFPVLLALFVVVAMVTVGKAESDEADFSPESAGSTEKDVAVSEESKAASHEISEQRRRKSKRTKTVTKTSKTDPTISTTPATADPAETSDPTTEVIAEPEPAIPEQEPENPEPVTPGQEPTDPEPETATPGQEPENPEPEPTTPGQEPATQSATEAPGIAIPWEDMDTAAEQLLASNARLIPLFVRMIFHDCVGGCDGCIDMSNKGNAGLELPIQEAKNFRSAHASFLSQADINAYLAVRAAEKGALNAGIDLKLTVKTGRKDCDANHMPTRILPEGTELQPLEFLKNEFKLSGDREAAALLGCHSLGRANPANSGFSGDWDLSPQKLDNGYYKNLAVENWVHEQVDNSVVKSFQWTKFLSSGQRFMMLTTDMIMFKQFTLDNTDKPSCDYKLCPAAPTANIVTDFANNQNEFITNLKSSFQKMIEHGSSNLIAA